MYFATSDLRSDEFLLDEQLATKLVDCMKRVLTVFEFECRFANIIDNYLSFEVELYRVSLLELAGRNKETEDSWLFLRHANRWVANILTSCREYFDASSKTIDSCFDNPQYSFDDLRSLQYDGVLSFRFMEFLRNYVQHKGFAVLNATFARSNSDYEGIRRQSVSFNVQKSYLASSDKYKKVEADLETFEENFSILPHLREYIDSISAIHADARTQLEGTLLDDEAFVRDQISRVTKNLDPYCSQKGFYIFEGINQQSAQQVEVVLIQPFEDVKAAIVKQPCPVNFQYNRIYN